MKTIIGGAASALAIGFALYVVASPDSCTRVDRGAAPVRIAMDGIRWAGHNWLSTDARLEMLKYSIHADTGTQRFLSQQFYGQPNVCKAENT
ncbi:MAG: hypothetical protein EOO81_11595 [Oxalobacteraceae bacterium]|uniref:hypothetical protein n=1 Tax=Noviherbaspirillum soli TaxID=1064518 RepID=UPI0010D8CF73|nr:hypothetical protein [Noviherbaspirillum soli]RYE66361.1 MAG: hypothetical protein EOO81_11595 [Oxalobacteraceae bacterium]